MRICITIVLFLFLVPSLGQESKKFDRVKWEELRGKIKYKKSPAKTISRSSESSDGTDNGTYHRDSESYGDGEERSGSRSAREKRERESADSSGFSSMGGLAKTILIVVAILLIAALVYFFVFKRKPDERLQNTVVEEEFEELDIHTIEKSDLELALEKALAEKDFRKCVRIYFTFILKELSSGGKIYWEKEKTNYDYLKELNNTKDFHGFRNAMELFEIIWYGKREISESIYLQLEPDLKNYLKQIATT
ncbi:MAG: hypothetical protein R2799_12920 [Crocinitomicaceae bacterium]